MVIAFIIIFIMLLGIYAVFVEPWLPPRITRHKVVVSPETLGQKPLQIVVMTDLHACWPWMRPERISRIVERVNSLEPDLIALLGDYHTAMHPPFAKPLASAAAWAQPMRHLKAPLGVFGVLGNHDWLEGGEDAREALEASGVTVLENRAQRVSTRGNSHVWLLGLDDQYGEACQLHGAGRRDDLEVALSQVEDDSAPRILLAHEPDIFLDAKKSVDLTVSGHTHGGQVRLPFIGALTIPSRLDRKYAKGAFEENGSTLIVGSGLGCSGLPIRFLCPPELLLIEIYA
ncbi:metallophosphoesterase [Pseudovibrio ascidiaceicola]|uniref:metallophosphoesterase n=1 Tax=Pseudovibrio ascidiaceicola TaxID=285279 RepID=UPI003D35F4D1